MEESYQKVISVLKEKQKFLICSHAHPDGDGIGSSLAMGRALKMMGKSVLIYNQDGVPFSLNFLSGAGELVNTVPSDEKFDATIMIDCAQTERAGKHFPSEVNRGVLVCIDHHITRSEEADIICQDANAASAGEVIYNILQRMNVKIDPSIATQILTTIIVDTGFFRYSNTTSLVLARASELVEKGADTWLVCKNMEERNPPTQLKLLSKALDTIEYILNGKVAVMSLTNQMFAEAGANVEDAEDFINFPRSIDGVEVAVLIREKNSKEFKISFRSKDTVDVAALANTFEGGGHKHAAGCNLNGSYGEVRQTIISALSKVI